MVDDHQDLRAAIRDTLAGEGYHVTEASNGIEALDLLGAVSFEAAVVDVRMPLLDGLGMLERMGQQGINCPVVLTSVMVDGSSIERGRQLGMFAFHQKPFVLDALLSDLARAVAGEPAA